MHPINKRPWLANLNLFLLLTVGGFLFLLFAAPQSPFNRVAGIRKTLATARMGDLPESAQAVTLDTQGAMVNRILWLNFQAAPVEIEDWVHDSLGTRGRTPILAENGEIVYDIVPQGEAAKATLFLSEDGGKATLVVSWSDIYFENYAGRKGQGGP